jgi:hypothetical protein
MSRLRAEQNEEDVEVVPIPLDGATLTRLAKFGQATGQHPVDAASALLRELLKDDDFFNAARRAALS